MNNRHCVDIAHISLGGGKPVVVQSMTSTATEDIEATTKQCIALANAGSELIRLTVNSNQAAKAIPYIKEKLLQQNIQTPLIGDFHFNGHRLLTEFPECAKALAKYRINPGNVDKNNDENINFTQLIEIAIKHQKAVRIGGNWGSLDQQLLANLMDSNQTAEKPLSNKQLIHQTLIQSTLESAKLAESIGLPANKIVISCKMSGVQDLIAIYQELAQLSPYALHLGLTEAGMGNTGTVSSSVALGVLLQQGIGDTIRISLTPQPGESRVQEIVIARQILQSLELRSFTPSVIACPGCGRTSSDFFRHLAKQTEEYLQLNLNQWRQDYPGVENMRVAVMGCVVNGPGESKHANIGISLPGTGEKPVAPIYEDGKKTVTLKGNNIPAEFQQIIYNYVQRHYAVQ